MSDCIFCKIVSGEIPARIVFETDDLLAFDDIAPQAPVHTLIIPKAHYADIADGVPVELLGALIEAVPRVADSKGVATTGYRTIMNTGADSGQSVRHLHVHVLGGRAMAEEMCIFRDGE